MLTGLHPFGVQTMRMEGPYPGCTYDPEKCKFWPSVFRQNGYFTGQIGKWHTGTDTGFGRDWDYQAVWNHTLVDFDAHAYYNNQFVSFNGAPPARVPGYSTDNYSEWASDFIRGKNRDASKPWYLWLCYGAVHGPYTPAERHKADYPGVKVKTPEDIYPPRPGKPDWEQKIETWVPGKSGEPVLKAAAQAGSGKAEKTLSDWVRQYAQCVRALDEGIGKVLGALEESGQLDNTLVVFTSDQGFAWGYHGFQHKLAPYDDNMRAPFIVSMPGTLPEGKVCRTPIGGVDLVPTFFHFAGVELPWEMHGHDLTPLLKDPDAAWPHATLLTHTSDSFGANTDKIPTGAKVFHKGGVPWWLSLREGKMKYIRALIAGEAEELYDVDADPEELKNLAPDPKHAVTLAKFRAAMIAELERTHAGFAHSLPPVRGAQD
jgi:arylsulfatase A-like enzyme